LAALVPFLISAANTAHAADTEVNLGTAKAFSVLAGSGVTNTGVTKLEGNIGSHETPTITTDTPFVFTGTGSNHAGDGVTQQAKADLLQAYNVVAGALPPSAVPQELTRNDPYLPGIYRASSSMLLSGAMTLDGGGRNDGVFIFQAPSTLTTESNSVVNFTNGAQPCNVYWQIGSSATFGTGTDFVGNVLAHTSITATTNATFEGRLLANFGAVTLDSNTISAPGCDTSPGGGTDTDSTAVNAGTDTDSVATDAGTDTDSTATDAGTDTEGTATGTDTDSAGAGAESVAGTTTAADVESATDTQIGMSTDTGANSTGTDTDSATGTDSTTDLPNTGGPGVLPMLIGLLAAVGGVVLIASAARTRRSSR
jgi:type VI secretion system secreted protein VgrG